MFDWLANLTWLNNLFWYVLGGMVVGSCVIGYFQMREEDTPSPPPSGAASDTGESLEEEDSDDATVRRLLEQCDL